MKKWSLLFLILIALGPINSNSATWNHLTIGEDQFFFFDSESISQNGFIKDLWVLIINREDKNQNDYSIKNKIRIDCKKKTFRSLAIINHNSKGTVTFMSSELPELVFDVAPDSMMDGISKKVCNKNFPREFLLKVEDPYQSVKTIENRLK